MGGRDVLRWVICPLIGLLAAIPIGAGAQTSCPATASRPVERLVCSSPHLVWEDRKLSALYQLAAEVSPAGALKLALEQRRWREDVRDRCSTPGCLRIAYASRSNVLRSYLNAVADPMPRASSWKEVFNATSQPIQAMRCEAGYIDYFTVDLRQSAGGKVIGAWEATTFCGNFINGGLVDVRKAGRIFDVRVLGGRGPSHQAGVALLVRKGRRLFVANMFPRSSVGAQGDIEFFYKAVLSRIPARPTRADEQHGETTISALDDAWAQTRDAAKLNGTCPEGQAIDVCIRKTEP